MFDFSSWLDLPLIWAAIIALAILLYVLLDGFDLGIGIIFPLAPSEHCRNRMMNSMAPFWDGNETWLVLGGGGLFAAFPLAYAILLPAFYIPLMIMLLGLILRGIAFEFHFKAQGPGRVLWHTVFHAGSVAAAFCQGLILGAFVQGVTVEGRHFAGGAFDWASAFSMMTGMATVFGYALLGSTWLVMKTEDITQAWARKVALYVLAVVAVFMLLVTIAMPLINEAIKNFWFDVERLNVYYLLPLPLLTLLLCLMLWRDLRRPQREHRPFFLSLGIFFLAYMGLGLSIYPWAVPFQYTLWEAAAFGPSLSLMLLAVLPLLPLILGYTALSYYIFRGKTDHEPHTY